MSIPNDNIAENIHKRGFFSLLYLKCENIAPEKTGKRTEKIISNIDINIL